MHLEVIETFEAFRKIRDAWASVYDADPEANFFMSHQWLDEWLHFRTSVWFVLAVKPTPESRDYVAFMPLRLAAKFDAKTGFTHELTLAGALYSDYTGLLCRPEAEKEAIPLFAAHIKRQLSWANFKLDNLLMSERRRRLLFKPFDTGRFENQPISYLQTSNHLDNGICPAADLPGTWDAYLDQLSSNNRQKIRRLLKKVDNGERYRITVLEGEDMIKGIETLLDHWQVKWLPLKGEKRTKDIIVLNRGMLRRCARNGTLFMPVFWDGDRAVATLGTLVDPSKKAMHFLITGRDETFVDLPSGYLLHAFSIRHAIAEGFRTYDFLRGNERYKYHFASREVQLSACELRTHNGRNQLGTIDLRCLNEMIELARGFESKGKRADAESAYRQIAEIAPEHALTLYRLGRLYARKGQHEEAVSWLRRSVEAEPAGDNAWKWLARSLQVVGEQNAAVEAWTRVIESQPGNEEAKRALADLRLAKLKTPSPSPVFLSPVAAPAVPSIPGLTPQIPQLSIPEGRFTLLEL